MYLSQCSVFPPVFLRFSHTCVQSDDPRPALLPEFSPRSASPAHLHCTSAPPSLAFPFSLWCFPARRPPPSAVFLPPGFHLHLIPSLGFVLYLSLCCSLSLCWSVSSVLITSHITPLILCLLPWSLCAPCVHLGFMVCSLFLFYCCLDSLYLPALCYLTVCLSSFGFWTIWIGDRLSLSLLLSLHLDPLHVWQYQLKLSYLSASSGWSSHLL